MTKKMASTSSSPANNSTSSSNERNNPNSVVGNNPNLNNLLNRGTGEKQNRQHAPSLSSMREYCLRWNNHQPNFVSFFTSLLNKEAFTDVTLVSSEGKKLLAHKLVLSACSPYFQHVFENNPCKHPIVILKDVHYADLKTIVSFIYNGEVNIAQDRMNSILATAGTLQVKGLAEVPADELKRVGGTKSENSAVRHQPSSPWTSGESDNIPSAEVPRKRLKKGNLTSASHSTNGDLSTSGSFESGVGASVSRSIDDGTAVTGLDGNSKPSTARGGPPPLTAASTPQTKSQSLDSGLDKERREANSGGGGGGGDSELSSGGFSENQNFDESSTGAERGYDLEVADVKMEDVDNDDGDFDDEDDSYGPDDNTEFGDSSYLNMPASSSAASYFQQSGFHIGARGRSIKARRGRLLIRQPRIKRLDAGEQEKEGGDEVEAVFSGGSHDDEEEEAAILAAAYKEKRFGIPRKDLVEVAEEKLSQQQYHQTPRQQSVGPVPIVLVSGSSPTPPSSPPILSIDESEFPPSPARSERGSFDSATTSTSKLLNIPSIPEKQSGSGSIITGQAGSVLVKQHSQPLLPSHTEVLSLGTPPVQRQHSTPAPSQYSNYSSRVLTSTPKPGTLTYLLPQHHRDISSEFGVESTYIMDTSTGIIQILSPVESNPGQSSSSTHGSFTRILHTGNKEMEVYKAESITKNDSADDPMEGSSFGGSMEEDPPGTSSSDVPVQRSGHCPVLRPGPALGCNYCWNSVDKCGRILRRKTKYHCPECHINLCIVPCFQEYHEKTDKKKPKGKVLLPKPSSM